MGLFSKLSQNLHHGGVKVVAAAPGSVSLKDPTLPISATITASQDANITWVRAELLAQPMNMAFNNQGETAQQISQRNAQITTVALNEMNQPFVMAAGETKTLQLNIIMNAGNYAASQAGDNPMLGAAAKAIGQLQTLSERLNPGNMSYSIKVTANVEGIALDPSDTRGISVNAPGQFGSTTNIRL